MPNIAGLITEYNPFHNGHRYHIDMAKELTKADYTVAVMSGNFLERGSMAILDKSKRAESAVLSGVDSVFELPFLFATGSADDFSFGACHILNSFNIVTHLVFGAECDDMGKMSHLAEFLTNENDDYKTLLNDNLKSGLSFPKARENAIDKLLGKEYSLVLLSPNNILALSYMIELNRMNSSIKPVIIKRIGNYHDKNDDIRGFMSAEAIRNIINDKTVPFSDIDASKLGTELQKKELLREAVPAKTYEYLMKIKRRNIIPNDNLLSDMLYLKILEYRSKNKDYEEIKHLLPVEIDKDIYNKILNIRDYLSFDETVNYIVSKNYTLSRIRRGLLHLILDISREKHDMIFNDIDNALYASILSFRKESSQVLKHINKNSIIPVINKRSLYSPASTGAKLLRDMDITSTDLYNYLLRKNFGISLPRELSSNIKII